MTSKSTEYRHALWFDVIVHADHHEISYRRRYKQYPGAYRHLLKLAMRYRLDGYEVTRVWENGHVHLLEKRGEPVRVLRLVGSVEWRRDWLPYIRCRDKLLRPVIAVSESQSHTGPRGRYRGTLRRWAAEAEKFAEVNR